MFWYSMLTLLDKIRATDCDSVTNIFLIRRSMGKLDIVPVTLEASAIILSPSCGDVCVSEEVMEGI